MSGKNVILNEKSMRPRELFQKLLDKNKGNILLVLFTAFACFSDLCSVYPRYDMVHKEGSIMMLFFASLCTVFIIDIPLSYAGTAVKEWYEGLKAGREMLVVLIPTLVAFVLVYLSFFKLSVEVGPYIYENISEANAGLNALYEEVETTESIEWMGLIGAILPFCTSIALFGLGFYLSSPLQDKINNVKMKIFHVENEISNYEQLIARLLHKNPKAYLCCEMYIRLQGMKIVDYDVYLEELKRFVKDLEDRYQEDRRILMLRDDYEVKNSQITMQTNQCQTAYLEALMKKLNTPESMSSIAQYAEESTSQDDIKLKKFHILSEGESI